MKRIILIIEDDENLRAALMAELEARCDCEVLGAAGARAGVHMAERRQPDVILLDTTLPELDTARVLEELHANPSTRDLPVILMEAGGGPGTRAASGAGRQGGGGVVGTIGKPVEGEALARSVEQLLAW
jgi:CheY-like chemotaxis protein